MSNLNLLLNNFFRNTIKENLKYFYYKKKNGLVLLPFICCQNTNLFKIKKKKDFFLDEKNKLSKDFLFQLNNLKKIKLLIKLFNSRQLYWQLNQQFNFFLLQIFLTVFGDL